ncbi:S-layer homology domain-containing protein [Cohnella caldifontis]|uniref:S-layer homology domain-containing protein n=1 Tax=Cohnella caldifontis TaxID=3027471 RepID=UPI0023EAD4AB|nr:S-layer homology domain-containing protein [Cohnella sp. YIM B05605]
MAGKTHYKQWVSAVALTATIWSGAAGSIPMASAATNPFSDVKSGHWAEKHVTKLALQGIILGSEGKFRPSDTIRREDAVIVALKFMGLADEIDTSSAIAFPSTFQVDDYAKPYVMEAFRRKLLLTDEEYALANSEKQSWGKAGASREWVARLLVRAIGKEAAAEANAGKSTSFSDNAKIDDVYRPYVLTAVQEGLVAGVTPTTFEPKQAINRASMATLFSKAESKVSVAYSGQVSGVLMSVKNNQLTLLHDDGSLHVYTLTPETMYARYDSDKPIDASALKLYSKAILIHDSNGAIGYVEQTDDNAYVKTVDGTFTKYSSSRSSVYLTVGDAITEYFYDSASEPAVTDAQGNTIKLADIPANAPITLTVDTIRSQPKIIAVAVKQALVNKTGKGNVVSWNASTGELQVSDPSTGSTETWSVSPQAAFTLGGIPVKSDALKAGNSISYEIKAGVVTGVAIDKPLTTSASGTLFDVSKTSRTIQFTENGELKAKFLADTVKVVIQGMASPGIDDLQKDDNIALTLDSNDKVTQITVTNRSVQYLTGATVVGYLADIKQLTLKDASGTPHNFILDTSVKYDQNGFAIDASQALAKLTTGKKITVSYSGDKAITIFFNAKYDGTVLENNLTSKQLTLRLDATNVVTVPYTYPYVEIYGVSTASFADIKPGDQVSVMLNDNQDQVYSIMVQKSAQYQIVSVDVFGNKLQLQKPDATTSESVSVPMNATLLDENGSAITLSRLVAGNTVNVTLSGKSTLTKLKVVPTVYGKVVAVNAAASTVDLLLPNGSTVTRTIEASPLILKNSTSNTSLSVLQPNDRVEIRKDESDKTIIEVIPGLQREFWQSTGSTFKVKVTNVNENNVYNFSTSTYIHQGTTPLAITQLANGDKITIYVWKNQVMEIEK